MSTFYEDNMNIKKINGFTLQQVSRDVWAIDEFGHYCFSLQKS